MLSSLQAYLLTNNVCVLTLGLGSGARLSLHPQHLVLVPKFHLPFHGGCPGRGGKGVLSLQSPTLPVRPRQPFSQEGGNARQTLGGRLACLGFCYKAPTKAKERRAPVEVWEFYLRIKVLEETRIYAYGLLSL